MILCLIFLCCCAVLSTGGFVFAQRLSQPSYYYWFGTIVIICSFALLLREHSNGWYRIDRWLLDVSLLKRSDKFVRSRAFPTVLGLCFLAVALCGLAWRWRHILEWQLLPWRADMLPTIEGGIRTFFAGANPYARAYWFTAPTPGIAPWQNRLYLPGLWLPYALAEFLGLDYKFVIVASKVGALTVFFCLVFGAWSRCRAADPLRQKGLWPRVALFSLFGTALGGLFFLKNLSWPLHTAPLWFYLALFCYLAIIGKTRAASAMLGVICATRDSAVVLVPAWLFFLLRSRGRHFWKDVWSMFVPFALLVGPFLLWNPREFIFSTVSSYEVAKIHLWEQHPEWVINSFGLSSPLFYAGLRKWIFPVQIAFQVGVNLFAWRQIHTVQDCLRSMTWALLFFYMTVFMPFFYIYVECILLLSFVVLSDLARSLQLDPTV
jgi:hypothetical protein